MSLPNTGADSKLDGRAENPHKFVFDDLVGDIREGFWAARAAFPELPADEVLVALLAVRTNLFGTNLFGTNPAALFPLAVIPAAWGPAPHWPGVPIEAVLCFEGAGIEALVSSSIVRIDIGYDAPPSGVFEDFIRTWLHPRMGMLHRRWRDFIAKNRRPFDHPIINVVHEKAGVDLQQVIDPAVLLVQRYERKSRDLAESYPKAFHLQWPEDRAAIAGELSSSSKWNGQVRLTAKRCLRRTDASSLDEAESAMFEALTEADGTGGLASLRPGDRDLEVSLGSRGALGWRNVGKKLQPIILGRLQTKNRPARVPNALKKIVGWRPGDPPLTSCPCPDHVGEPAGELLVVLSSDDPARAATASVTLVCHAGCPIDAICNALGGSVSDRRFLDASIERPRKGPETEVVHSDAVEGRELKRRVSTLRGELRGVRAVAAFDRLSRRCTYEEAARKAKCTVPAIQREETLLRETLDPDLRGFVEGA